MSTDKYSLTPRQGSDWRLRWFLRRCQNNIKVKVQLKENVLR